MSSRAPGLPTSGWPGRLGATSLVAGLFLFALSLSAGEPPPPPTPASKAFDPTSAYHEREIEGWRVLVNQRLSVETNLCEHTLKLLAAQLKRPPGRACGG
jgi:hypothetical protein